jgi:hypothetical protein
VDWIYLAQDRPSEEASDSLKGWEFVGNLNDYSILTEIFVHREIERLKIN